MKFKVGDIVEYKNYNGRITLRHPVVQVYNDPYSDREVVKVRIKQGVYSHIDARVVEFFTVKPWSAD